MVVDRKSYGYLLIELVKMLRTQNSFSSLDRNGFEAADARSAPFETIQTVLAGPTQRQWVIGGRQNLKNGKSQETTGSIDTARGRETTPRPVSCRDLLRQGPLTLSLNAPHRPIYPLPKRARIIGDHENDVNDVVECLTDAINSLKSVFVKGSEGMHTGAESATNVTTTTTTATTKTTVTTSTVTDHCVRLNFNSY
ncbi:hypothetical protein BT96DRAFT_938104 [Gymnopus androsaceus JB14]|uniref:Uncharacterized protein n=1 Tax=Gymnopus androsaceus JB14 TaxID=1447944 RepID=A0A6A4HTY8_9AGAR|nr:hypothetical protein BT96DRAFT_938104 [Gymnopus androsaceus JB14]